MQYVRNPSGPGTGRNKTTDPARSRKRTALLAATAILTVIAFTDSAKAATIDVGSVMNTQTLAIEALLAQSGLDIRDGNIGNTALQVAFTTQAPGGTTNIASIAEVGTTTVNLVLDITDMAVSRDTSGKLTTFAPVEPENTVGTAVAFTTPQFYPGGGGGGVSKVDTGSGALFVG